MLFLVVILALLPILWLVVALGVMHMAAYKACSIALIIALVIATGLYDMTAVHAAQATLQGVALACWPVLAVIIAAIFTYNLCLHTKAMDVIKAMLTSVSHDRRVIGLLIAWGFGGFLEGMAGFGTATAIPAGMLVGVGLNPIMAASMCLVANSVPTAFGAVGIPSTTLASVGGHDAITISMFTSLQLAPLTLLCPFIITAIAGGSLKALKGNMFIMCIAAGLGFVIPEVFIASFVGPELADVAGGLGALVMVILCAKYFPVNNPLYHVEAHEDAPVVTFKKAVVAWLPFILIFIFLLATSNLVPVIHDPLNTIKTSVQIYEGAAPYTFTWIAMPGVLIMLAAFIGGGVQGAGMGEMLGVFKRTFFNLRFTILTIITVIATAEVMGFSGMTHEIAVSAVAATGAHYPLLASFIGSIGTFITGSATSSNVLFGALQQDAAVAIGANDAAQAWIVAANATGACAGKMVSPQTIAISVASIGCVGIEGKLLQFAVKLYIPFLIVMGCIVFFGQALL